MGGKSSSSQKSSNTYTTTTKTTNESLNSAISGDVEAGGYAVSGKTVEINQVDPGVFDFAGKTIEGVGGIITQLLENQKETYSAANDLAGSAISNIAAASGVEPVEFGKRPFTQEQKLWISAGGFISFSIAAYAYFNSRGRN